jgi:uncharacterized membrane protein YuzA (DUF378 family)
MKDSTVCKFCFILAALGAINWSLTTAAGINPVAKIFGKSGHSDFWGKAFAPKSGFAKFFEYGPLERWIYILIGIAGAVSLVCVLRS